MICKTENKTWSEDPSEILEKGLSHPNKSVAWKFGLAVVECNTAGRKPSIVSH
jgi:hypothetical protein